MRDMEKPAGPKAAAAGPDADTSMGSPDGPEPSAAAVPPPPRTPEGRSALRLPVAQPCGSPPPSRLLLQRQLFQRADGDGQAVKAKPTSPSRTKRRRETVRLNVGGTLFETSADTLVTRDHQSMLAARMLRWQSGASDEPGGVLWLDRDGGLFGDILNYLRTGRVFLTKEGELEGLKCEAEFYGLKGLSDLCQELLETRKREAAAAQLREEASDSLGKEILREVRATKEAILLALSQQSQQSKEAMQALLHARSAYDVQEFRIDEDF
eukprot:SM000003S10986  [mRNA]  locus=s3:92320:93377:- [translate_table: standard]